MLAPVILIPLIFYLSAIAPQNGTQVAAASERVRYASSVSYYKGKCEFWTGDVGFNARGFREDLRSRFDRSWGITVYHLAIVPQKCVRKAFAMAMDAGFRDVKDQIGEVYLGAP